MLVDEDNFCFLTKRDFSFEVEARSTIFSAFFSVSVVVCIFDTSAEEEGAVFSSKEESSSTA